VATLAVDAVRGHLEQRLRRPLRVLSGLGSLYHDVEVDRLIPDEGLEGDGDVWEVYVFRTEEDWTMLVEDDGSPLEEDVEVEGLYWYRDDEPGGPYWMALTNYADNVQLVWMTPSDVRRVSSAWEAVDAALGELAEQAR
jgi:hypothetical protein